MGVSDKDDAEEDLGFGTTRFNVRKGHGYTSLSVRHSSSEAQSDLTSLNSTPRRKVGLSFRTGLKQQLTANDQGISRRGDVIEQ